jgi:hypothetical protein
MTCEAATVVEHSSEEVGPNGGRRSRVGGGFLGDVWSMDKGGLATHMGQRRPGATGAERSPHGEHGHREQGCAQDRAIVPSGQNGNRPLTGGPGPVNIFSNFQTPLRFANSKRKYFLALKIFKLCTLLDFQILNNFLNWVDLEFSTEFML